MYYDMLKLPLWLNSVLARVYLELCKHFRAARRL